MKRALLVALMFAAAACRSKSGGGVDLAPPDMTPPALLQKVDVLFLLDNSASVTGKYELVARFPEFAKALDAAAAGGHPASYHIGVITSDVGAGSYTLNNGQCHPDGDGGKLRAGPAPGSNSPPSCAKLDLGGVRYIDYDQLTNTNNIGGGLDLPSAFSCIGSVGGGGCGFEAPLEAIYRALHDDLPENQGFLRADALLVVVFVMDEDDCSAPSDTNLFDPNATQYGPLHSFRCTQYGVTCGLPPGPLPATTDGGPWTNCRPLAMAEGGKLTDLGKYIDLFTQPASRGGLKVNPSDIIVKGIFPPPSPVGVQITSPCADQVNTASCPILKHSCLSAADNRFFGDPGVRLDAFLQAVPNHSYEFYCETDYAPIYDRLAEQIVARLQ